jgi:RNA polymerase sigma-70 factor (ECF subfamily)
MAHSAAETLYQQHRQRVYHLCLRLGGGNRAWAEDATQDVFVRLLERLDQLAAQDDLGAWIYRVTVNTCMTRLKREGSIWGRVSRALAAGSREAQSGTPERQVQVSRDLQGVLEELERLPAKERVVFCMRCLDEKPQNEIASTLGLSPGYVSKLLARARGRLERRGWEVHDEP